MSNPPLHRLQVLLRSQREARETLRAAQEDLARIDVEIIRVRREDASQYLRNFSLETSWALDFSVNEDDIVLTPWDATEDDEIRVHALIRDLGINKGTSQYLFDGNGRVRVRLDLEGLAFEVDPEYLFLFIQ